MNLKKEQRKQALAARRALTSEKRTEKNRIICVRFADYMEELAAGREKAGLPPVKTIFSYAAAWDEVDLTEFHWWAETRGMRIAYPLCHGKGIMEAVIPGRAWRTGAYGILEPVPEYAVPVKPEEIDMCIIPCVAFDGHGGRLGHGAGYYDRYLPKLRKDAVLVLAAFEEQRLENVQMDENDVAIPVSISDGDL